MMYIDPKTGKFTYSDPAKVEAFEDKLGKLWVKALNSHVKASLPKNKKEGGIGWGKATVDALNKLPPRK